MNPIVATALALCLAAPPSQIAEAEKLADAAIEAFDAGDYAKAVAKFEAAYEVDPEPSYLFNAGRVYEETGDLEQALQLYERFAREPHLALEEREAAAERIRVLRALVDPESSRQPTPPDSAQEPPPAQPAVAEDDPVSPGRPLIVAGAVLAGTGAATAVAGTVGFGLLAQGRSDRVSEVSSGSNPDRLTLTDVEDLDAQGRTFEVWQIASAVAGGTLAVVGGVLLGVGLARERRRREQAQVSLNPMWTRNVRGLGLSGRF